MSRVPLGATGNKTDFSNTLLEVYCRSEIALSTGSIALLTRIRGLNPPPLGELFLGWGLNPHPKNLAFNFQLSTF
jgi:hypothetical protein